MVTRAQAELLVLQELERWSAVDAIPWEDDPCVIAGVTERETCFVVHYTLQSAITDDTEDQVLGNAPLIVERSTGRMIRTGTARSTGHYVRAFERVGDPKAAYGGVSCDLHITKPPNRPRRWAAWKHMRRTLGSVRAWVLVSRVVRRGAATIRDLDYCEADALAHGLTRLGYEMRFSAGEGT